MKKVLLVGLAVLVLLAVWGCKKQQITLKTKKDKLSYAIGLNYGKRITGDLERQKVDLDSVVAAAAKQRAIMEEEAKKKAGGNIKAGNAFLEKNKKEKGVVALPSGLQYKIIKKGTGKKPTKENTVQCHYRGTLIDGTEFDSSHKRGQPASFSVGGVIPGWTEALQLMREGAQWKLFIPAHLAYGNRSAGPTIKPGSTLIFDIELIKIQ
jgi:FKBP-type peptidyl-prolyl cis-trans isomerase FklB